MPLIPMTVSCDVCGLCKKEVNHWFVSWQDGTRLGSCAIAEIDIATPGLYFACGVEHINVLNARFLASGSFEKESL